MSGIRIAINGFGRIGRQAFKIALTHPELEVVAVNDLTEPAVLAGLLKYDSNYGPYGKQVSSDNVKAKANPIISAAGNIIVEGKKVIISAPAKDEGVTPTYIIGVNHDKYKGEKIISNASCTTNCITPVIAVLHSKFGVKKLMMSTIHSYTAEQNLVDGPPPGGKSNDMRRARAAAINIIPTSTGATIATTEAIPELKGFLGGAAYRVPTSCGSLSDFTILLNKRTTKEEINQAFIEASKNPLWSNVLEVTTDPIVSTDIIGNPHSSIIDL